MTDATLDAGALRRDAPAENAPQAAGRLGSATGVDRGRKIAFTWDGKSLEGHPGDTLASALLAAGERIVARSFKYHRPRGVMSAGVEEGGAIVSVGQGARKTPNVNAATQELYDGLYAHGQNAWPSVRLDFGSVNSLAAPFFSAGFYYKTFFSFLPYTPKGTGHWMLFEAAIRRAAGMGRASRDPDPDQYEHAHAFCDALVVGAGPAGLSAARQLAEAGQDVILVEQDFELGGRLMSERALVEGQEPVAWRDAQIAAIRKAGGTILRRTTAFGLYDGGVAGLIERVADHVAEPAAHQVRQRVWIVRAGRTVLATGAIEQGLAFGDNDRPGVMSAGAAQTYANRFGVLAGRRVAVATAHDGGYAVAEDLAAAGAEVTLLDARADAPPREAGFQVLRGTAPLRAIGARGVAALEMARDTTKGWAPSERLDCDLIAVAGGWAPAVHLSAHRGVKPVWDARKACFLAGPTDEPLTTCGAAAGETTAEAAAASGRNAAAAALGQPLETIPTEAMAAPLALYEVKTPGRKLKSFVDPQHDVTTDDVRLAHREGYVSVEHLKRYTTLGMATDQGKNGNLLGMAAMAEALGVDLPDVGTTTFRPPYTPVSIGALAGRARGAHYKPERLTPMHAWNLRHGAVMTDAGLWKRPWYFPKSGETIDDAYVREATAVRETVGLCDVTSLGKIAIQGPDAAAFLNRVYVNGFGKLGVGKARYGVMLRDDGVVFDDGTTWRLSETDFFMTTTTAGAGKVMSFLEELLQTRWPELKVALASVSDRWAGFAVAGPLARRVLSGLIPDLDFDDASFPFMGVREGTLGDGAGGARCRIARISFSGELAYEIYVESDYGEALADALWDAAEPLGGVLYGTEALGAMRIEKGHVAGSELDGRTTLGDLGLAKMASSKKSFIGKVLATRPALQDPQREQLVGLIPADGESVFKAGAILCAPEAIEGHGVGWVSAVTHSPALGHWIGLGLISGGAEAWKDRDAVAADPVRGLQVRVRVVPSHFIDPAGDRMKPGADPEIAQPIRPAPSTILRRSALGGVSEPQNAAGFTPQRVGRGAERAWDDLGPDAGDAPAWLIEAGPRPLYRLAAWAENARDAADLAAEVVGAEAAPKPGRLVLGAQGAAARVGPLEWWLLDATPSETQADRAHECGALLELSHAFGEFRVGGRAAAALLNRHLAIDLRDRAFSIGAAAGADLHHLPVTLMRLGDQTYALWVPRSFAASIWEMLVETQQGLTG